MISVEILEPVEGDDGGNVLLPDGAIEVPVVARVVVPTAEAHNCSFRISLNDIVDRQASAIAKEGHVNVNSGVAEWISPNSFYLRPRTVLLPGSLPLMSENDNCCEFVVRCSCFVSDERDEVVGEASVLYSALVEKQAAQQRAKRNAALAAEHANYRDGKAATCRQPKPDGELVDRFGDPHASTPVTHRLQLFVDHGRFTECGSLTTKPTKWEILIILHGHGLTKRDGPGG